MGALLETAKPAELQEGMRFAQIEVNICIFIRIIQGFMLQPADELLKVICQMGDFIVIFLISKTGKNLMNAFWVGGLICAIGQALLNGYQAESYSL